MNDDMSHTEIAPQKATTEFLKAWASAAGARYGGRWVFGLLEKAGTMSTRSANAATSLFSGAVAGTVTYLLARNVKNDIRNVFAETVGMELGKESSEVDWKTLDQSKNVLVQEAVSNFRKFNGIRTMGVAGFLAGALPLRVPGAYKEAVANGPHNIPMLLTDGAGMELGMFTISGALLYDTQRPTTFFEELTHLVNTKFNENGIGKTIQASDLAVLFQRYAQKHKPELKFNGISDINRWNNSEILFERMAYLMEHSYRMKKNVADVVRGEASEITLKEQANFKLPKFLYLLGTGHINPEKVPESLAFVEIANTYGMEAVKKVDEMISHGASLERCLEQFPVTIPGKADSPVQLQGDDRAAPFMDGTNIETGTKKFREKHKAHENFVAATDAPPTPHSIV